METVVKENLSKEDYYQKIMGMTLNTSVDEILDILQFVESVESNNKYCDLFYNNLYVLVEKEKYLKANFNAEPKIYPRLSDKDKAILEYIFVNGLKGCSDQESSSIREELQTHGYEGILDRRCQKFFDKCEFENKQTYDLDEGKCHAYFDYMGTGWDNKLARRFIVKVSERSNLHIYPGEKCKEDKIVKVRNLQNRVDTDSDFYFVQSNAVSSGGFIRRYAINRSTGERTRIPNRYYFPQYALGYYIKEYSFPKLQYVFYDEKFNKVHTLCHVDSFFVDYRLEVFITCEDNVIKIYNKELKKIKEIDLGKDYRGYKIVSANGGFMVLSYFADRKVAYYDYINMRQIDLFNCSGNYTDHLAYNEGVYNCIGDDGNHCYKRPDGKIIIDQVQDTAYPFLGNIAKVGTGNKTFGSEEFFLDRTGKYTSKEEMLRKLYQSKLELYGGDYGEYRVECVYPYLAKNWDHVSFYIDHKSGRYQLIYQPVGNYYGTNVGWIVAQDNYFVNNDTPIIEIDFDGKNKNFEKVSPNNME